MRSGIATNEVEFYYESFPIQVPKEENAWSN